jgi:hypothetical protein
MSERPTSKAAKLAYDLTHTPMSEREQRRRGMVLPELRLRSDAPTIEVDERTPVVEALSRLVGEQDGLLALRTERNKPQAVVLSLDRYLQLAGQELNSAATPKAVRLLDGRLAPQEAAFTRSHVEQADPGAVWGDQS